MDQSTKSRKKERSLSRLMKLLNSLETRIPTIQIQRIDEVFPIIKEVMCKINPAHSDCASGIQDLIPSELIKKEDTVPITFPVLQPEEKYTPESMNLELPVILQKSKNEHSFSLINYYPSPNNNLCDKNMQIISTVCDNSRNVQDKLPSNKEHLHSQSDRTSERSVVHDEVNFTQQLYLSDIDYKSQSQQSGAGHHPVQIGQMELKLTTFNENLEQSPYLDKNHLIGDTVKNTKKRNTFTEIKKQCSTLKQCRFLPSQNNLQKCDQCNKTFARNSSLERHLLIHSVQPSFQCDICKKVFVKCSNLKSHLLIHTRQRSFECDICKKTFSVRGNLKKHQLIHTGQRFFECDTCKKCFVHRFHLKTHQLIHAGQHPFECDICKKTFSLRSSFKNHQLVHTGQRPFECDICKKTFTQRSNIKNHQVVHTGQHPFECDICKKTFSLRGHLKRHQLIHTGQRPFECDICKKTFSQCGNLKTHQLIHTGQHPFECDISKKSFSQCGNLKTHQSIHTRLSI